MDWNIWGKPDLRQYFDGTYIGLADKNGKIQPCYVKSILDGFEGDNGREQGFIGQVNRKVIAASFNNPDVRIIVPESCFVNTGYQAVYLSRLTQRQYKKGIKLSQFKKEYTNMDIYERIGDDFRPEDYIRGLLNPEYPTLEEALKNLERGRCISSAFSRHFCVGVDEKVISPLLFYRGIVCGTIKDGAIELNEGFTALEDKLIEVMEGEND